MPVIVSAPQSTRTVTVNTAASVAIQRGVPDTIQVDDARTAAVVNRQTDTAIVAGSKGAQGAQGDQGVPGTALEIFSAVNTDVLTLRNGQPVALTGANTIARAANDSSARNAIGLMLETSLIVGGSGRVLAEGDMTLATTEWDNVTGAVGGLTPTAVYFLGSTLGTLTTTPPTAAGTFSRVIGRARSSTVMQVCIQPLIVL